jgi:hypothetical protein
MGLILPESHKSQAGDFGCVILLRVAGRAELDKGG